MNIKNMIRVAIAGIAISLLTACATGIQNTPNTNMVNLSKCRYTLDRIEMGEESSFAVIEIYDTESGHIYMVDVDLG